MRLCGRLIRVADLTADDRREMRQLMERYYTNVVPVAFDADLAEKRWIIRLFDNKTGELCGFSTQMVLDATVHGRPIKALFSGDTIIDRKFWGDRALMQVGGRLALSLIEEWPNTDLYWFLISQGYKTYRMLPVFFQEFFPRYDVPMPADLRNVVDTLASQKFPDRYDAATGVIRANSDQYRLRSGVADVTPERLRDPHVRYFIQQNPGHAAGDELCCIARLSRDNFTEAAFRVLGSEQ